MPTAHSELWAQTWQVVSLGMLSTFVFLGLLVFSLRAMSMLAKRGEEKQSTKTNKQ